MKVGRSKVRYSALVLAAQRGVDDPLAGLSPKGHKCLLPITGRPMIERVIAALIAAQEVGVIAISIDRPEVLEEVPGFAELIAAKRLRVVQSAETPATSVLEGMAALDNAFPVLVTTADHALMTPGMIASFCQQAEKSGAAISAGLVHRSTIEAAVPEAKRTYLTFRDGGYSGANLFLLRDEKALCAVDFWRRVERDRKRPWRIARAFGPWLLLLFLLRLLSLEGAMARISRPLGAKAGAVVLDQAEAAVDVDKPEDIPVAEALLAQRGSR